MIPFFEQPTLRIGPVTLYAFGALVAAAVLAGAQLAMRRSRREGLDEDVCLDLAFYVVVSGFVAAHLYAVLAYFPREVLRSPLLLLKVWENISSFGGIAGAVLGFWIFFRFKGRGLSSRQKWGYVDAIAWAFPFAWALGRLGCTVAHDHPGTVTRLPIGVSLAAPQARAYIADAYRAAGRLAELPPPDVLAGMAFNDLGWYEFLYTAIVVVPAIALLGRNARPPGFFPVAFVLLYAPVRFALDFLRIADARYLGLTPGQYAAGAAFVAAAWVGLRVLPRAGAGKGGGA